MARAAAAKQEATGIHPVTDGGNEAIAREEPYRATIEVEGTANFIFHRWNCEAVAEKAGSKKGSAAKKTDNVESYVYRTPDGELAIPGEYFRQSLIHSAKFSQDPRSPRKSAMDLFKAGIVVLTELCPLGTKQWDLLDQRRVSVQRNGITRVRPAMLAGWQVTVDLMVLTPEYVSPQMLNEVLSRAGKLVGVGDFRPTYGRYQINSFSTLSGS